jgi:hypothetical protein
MLIRLSGRRFTRPLNRVSAGNQPDRPNLVACRKPIKPLCFARALNRGPRPGLTSRSPCPGNAAGVLRYTHQDTRPRSHLWDTPRRKPTPRKPQSETEGLSVPLRRVESTLQQQQKQTPRLYAAPLTRSFRTRHGPPVVARCHRCPATADSTTDRPTPLRCAPTACRFPMTRLGRVAGTRLRFACPSGAFGDWTHAAPGLIATA